MNKARAYRPHRSPRRPDRRATAATAPIALCALALMAGAAAATPPSPTAVAVTTAAYDGYGPGPMVPPCTRAEVRLAISLAPGSYLAGSPVPFKVSLANISARACSVTASQPPSGLTTELVYTRIFDSKGREVLIPDHFPGLRTRMLPQSLGPHQSFSYACTWDGRIWSAAVAGRPVGINGMAAPAGAYTAVAVLAKPAIKTHPLHFVLKGHAKAAA